MVLVKVLQRDVNWLINYSKPHLTIAASPFNHRHRRILIQETQGKTYKPLLVSTDGTVHVGVSQVHTSLCNLPLPPPTIMAKHGTLVEQVDISLLNEILSQARQCRVLVQCMCRAPPGMLC
jgi:hypothetical protein